MSPAISFQDKYERTWIDEFGPYVFAQVSKLSNTSEIKKTNARKVDAVKGRVRSLSLPAPSSTQVKLRNWAFPLLLNIAIVDCPIRSKLELNILRF